MVTFKQKRHHDNTCLELSALSLPHQCYYKCSKLWWFLKKPQYLNTNIIFSRVLCCQMNMGAKQDQIPADLHICPASTSLASHLSSGAPHIINHDTWSHRKKHPVTNSLSHPIIPNPRISLYVRPCVWQKISNLTHHLSANQELTRKGAKDEAKQGPKPTQRATRIQEEVGAP